MRRWPKRAEDIFLTERPKNGKKQAKMDLFWAVFHHIH